MNPQSKNEHAPAPDPTTFIPDREPTVPYQLTVSDTRVRLIFKGTDTLNTRLADVFNAMTS